MNKCCYAAILFQTNAEKNQKTVLRLPIDSDILTVILDYAYTNCIPQLNATGINFPLHLYMILLICITEANNRDITVKLHCCKGGERYQWKMPIDSDILTVILDYAYTNCIPQLNATGINFTLHLYMILLICITEANNRDITVKLHCCKGDERYQWEMPFFGVL